MLLCTIAALIVTARPVAACSLDGVPTLSGNSVLATSNALPPTRGTMSTWAPFSLSPVTPGSSVVLREDLHKLTRTLPLEGLKTPFRWHVNDGGTGTGTVVTHRFARAGWYKVEVRYFWQRAGGWILFDSAQIHVTTTSATPAYGSLLGPHLWLMNGLAVLLCGCLALAARPFHRTRHPVSMVR